VKGVVIPMLFGRLVRLDPASSETDPVVNVPASLVAAVVLTLVAFVATRPIVESVRGVPITLVPFGFATVLIGFFVLVARRKAVSQMVGLLLVDNGIGLVALLLTTGVPLLIELGGTLDVLLVVVVLRVLVTRMHAQLGVLDLDSLQELRD
jgi:hydrogenase-4 component E